MQTNAELYKLGAGSQESRKPMEVIRDFFQQMHLEDLKEMLGDFLYVILTSESLQFEKAIDRDNAIFTVRQIIEVLIAAHSLIKPESNE